MSHVLVSVVCGFLGGVVATAVVVLCILRSLPEVGGITISRGSGPRLSKEIEILEHSERPNGVYVRFKNTGAESIEMAHFKIRGYRDGKLWAEFEESVYSETRPGQEQEGILSFRNYRDPLNAPDISDCRIEVTVLYGCVESNERA